MKGGQVHGNLYIGKGQKEWKSMEMKIRRVSGMMFLNTRGTIILGE